nr:U-box domain-containing protein 28-like [Tanacetum cinerariifolium]
MQVLQSTDVVPNLTLRRLIRVWSDSYLLRNTQATDNEYLSFEELKKLVNTHEYLTLDTLNKVVFFAKSSRENCESLARLEGLVAEVVNMLRKSYEIEVVEMGVVLLDLLLLDQQVKQQMVKLNVAGERNLALFNLIFIKGSLEGKVCAARVLETLAAFDTESRRLIAEDSVLLGELCRLMTSHDVTAINAGLTALITVATSRQTKKELVRLGVVKNSGKMLAGPEKTVAIIEKVLKLLEMVSTCTEGRTAICEDENCVSGAVNRLMKVSPAATEHGIGVIWSVCYMSRDRTAQEAAIKMNGLTKILLVMQSNVSGSVRQMCVVKSFYFAFGFQINLNKSQLLGVGVPHSDVVNAAILIGCSIMNNSFRYLGVLVGHHSSRLSAWDDTIDKLKARLSKWKMKALSIGGTFHPLEIGFGRYTNL